MDVGLAGPLGWDVRADPWSAELVLCLERVGESVEDLCGDGRELWLRMSASDYEVTLRAAESGAVLDRAEWHTDAPSECPFVVGFREGETFRYRYSFELPVAMRFLRPWVGA